MSLLIVYMLVMTYYVPCIYFSYVSDILQFSLEEKEKF